MKYIKVNVKELLASESVKKLPPKEKEKLAIKERISKYHDDISYEDLRDTFDGFNGEKENREVLKRFIYNLYFRFNKKFFNNKLKIPIIRVGDVYGHNDGSLGFWNSIERVFYIDSKLFNSNFNNLEETVLHEMCHQAVDDIDKIHPLISPEDNKTVWTEKEAKKFIALGHGKEWKKWMRHCGLKPEIFFDSIVNKINYDKEKMDERKQIYTLTNLFEPITIIKKHQPVMFINKKQLTLGVIFSYNKSKGKATVYINKENNFIPYFLPIEKLFVPTPELLEEFNKNKDKWKKAVYKVPIEIEEQ